MLKKTFYLLFASALLFSCKKEEPTPTPAAPSPTTPTTPSTNNFFISAKLDGTTWSVQHNVNEYYLGVGHSANIQPNGDMTLDYNASISQSEPTNTPSAIGDLEVGLSGFFTNLGPYTTDNAIFDSHFTLGSKPYFVDGSSTSGAEIKYYDGNNNEYSTRYGDQTGSTFNLTSAENTTLNGSDGKLSKATFSCKLYSQGGPGYITVTDGSFYVIFDKY